MTTVTSMLEELKQQVEELNDSGKYTEAADLVAQSFRIKMEVLSSRFGSMSWDTDGQQRYIQTIKLTSVRKKSYKFEFGNSVVDSCKLTPKIDTMKDDDKVEVYAGLSLTKNNKTIYCGEKLNLTLTDLANPSQELIELTANKLHTEFFSNVDAKHKELVRKFDEGEISRNQMRTMSDFRLEEGAFIQCVQNAIRREYDKLKTDMVYSDPIDTPPVPTMYDILCCLTKYDPGSFEDFCADFGYDEDSRAAERTYNAVLEEFNSLSELFTEEELEVLQLIN